MKKFAIAIMTMVALTSVSAEAQERRWPNWYFGIHAQMAFIDDSDVTVGGVNAGDLEYKTGYGAGASLGYMPGTGTLLDNMRFELEYSFTQADIDSLNGVNVSDDLSYNTYMVNAFYDFQTGTGFLPYVGAGAGVADAELNLPVSGADDHDTVFAYQFMAGVGYASPLMPNTVVSLGYRYLGAEDPSFSAVIGSTDIELESHNIELGARFAF